MAEALKPTRATKTELEAAKVAQTGVSPEKRVGRKRLLSGKSLKRAGLALVVLGLLGGFWLLPIRGKVLILADPAQNYLGAWPQIALEPLAAPPGSTITLTLSDLTAWNGVKLYIQGSEAQLLNAKTESSGITRWQWRFNLPAQPDYSAIFYHDCAKGCLEGAHFHLGQSGPADLPPSPLLPTKLGVVFADENRDWHGRAGWNVELVYSQQPDGSDFSVDNLARRVQQSQQKGLRVLVRIAYDRAQALPPAGDEAALNSYLQFCTRLARDARLNPVYGYIIGSGFNRKSENSLSPEHLVTPEWYARVFNGYSLDARRTDNVLQTLNALNPNLRVLVGPVTPWANDQGGDIKDLYDQPWLNYMRSLVAHLDEGASAKQRAGFGLAAPAGFAVQAPGRPEAPEIASQPAQEPATDLHQPQWGQAEAGFRIYRDWQRIINGYSTSQNLPIYITSTNTYTTDSQIEPEQNYPAGWLTTALAEINREAQVQALCWFVDLPYDKWASFSLKAGLGHLGQGYAEFDRLLR